MKIIKGKHAGQEVSVKQFYNGWFVLDPSVDWSEAEVAAITLDQVQLTSPEEVEMVRSSPNAGHIWKKWTLQEDGTFHQLPGFLEEKVIPPISLPRW